jgi:hypothetical protein
MDAEHLKHALRELFQARVMNHGDYSLVYAQPLGAGPALVIGYRRTLLELVLCPVEVWHLSPSGCDGRRAAARVAAPIISVALTNVATVADTGTGYQVQTVTGFRAGFEVTGAPRIPWGSTDRNSDEGTVVLEQGEDAEDFHQFMGHFMDVLDAFYEVPDDTESLTTLLASA